MIKAIHLCVVWAQELGLPWVAKAREAAEGKTGSSRGQNWEQPVGQAAQGRQHPHPERLLTELPESLTDGHRTFLLGLVKGGAGWSLMACPHLRDLPAIRWKFENLARLQRSNPRKLARQATELEARL